MSYVEIIKAAQNAGLIVMGAFLPRAAQTAADNIGTVIMLGTSAGFWPCFSTSPEYLDGAPDPIDRYSKRVVGDIAQTFDAQCKFPSDGPPYPPFISWALASDRFHLSPVGMMVHDTAGLMISLRGSLLLETELALPKQATTSPCLACAAPCISACPVGALAADTPYDVDACHAHLSTPAGADCMNRGCIARRACPTSVTSGRTDAQSALHMKAFHPS